ncbi:hypothetical protein Ade02nite_52860 [Paractinoplanes deccanensis]|uniref:Uncharacterized protein n=1 Tax=Paractinoplanes deccanensis TaxID=113561 RepID=A0ABQ3Y9P0_9ACTN|nr:hypothetical protein Ade02nite_52860 [Actinoplanes deccanensis]
MTQLSFFSRAQLAAMRDRTAARNFSPERDAFRRDHKRRRDHGKARRHALRIYQQFQASCPDEPPPIPPRPAPRPPRTRPAALRPPRPRAAPTSDVPHSGTPSGG